MNDKAEDLAFGRWPDILTSRGMESSFFNCKQGPCPFCWGRDRYRWVQKKYGGVWVCNSCTDGKYATGFNMLMQHMGYQTFREAADDVREFFGAQQVIRPIPREQRLSQMDEWTPERIQRNTDRMLRSWEEGRDITSGDPVSLYMSKRVPGMDFVPAYVRYHPALDYWAPPPEGQDRPILLGRYPAMLSLALAPDGSIAQLHKTYLTLSGEKADVPLVKKTDLGVGQKSFAVRMLKPVGDKLGICEGMETGWAAAMLRDIPIWSCLNGPALAEFVLPEELRGQIKTLVIFADADELKVFGRQKDGSSKMMRPGSVYAEKLAQSARQMGLKTLIIRPAREGNDMADYWQRQQKDSPAMEMAC